MPMSYPSAPFRHLQRLTDHVGLLEHAEGIVPRYEHGYCVDDVARGLVVVCREPSPSEELITLGRRYLHFLAQAQAADGQFHNRLGSDRRWHDQPGTQDCWGRALWALGTAAARGPTREIREESLTRFRLSARASSTWPHAMAFAALGAAEILERWRGDSGALALLDLASTVIGEPPEDPAWPWPAARLSYANAAIAEAVIVAGWKLGRDQVLGHGLRMLEWLLAGETRNGHLSVVPAGGWGPGEVRPAFDQQPIEVAALADACMRAAEVTGDRHWLAGAEMSVAWFLGDNDAGIPLLDEQTGGGCDSLGPAGRSRNQGAESTLAMISVMQQGRLLAAAAR
ncbi:MAG TPA: glycosyltransferase [Streptosporangiaceae bacterium]